MSSTHSYAFRYGDDWILSIHKQVQPGLWFGIEADNQQKLLRAQTPGDQRKISRGRVANTITREDLRTIVVELIQEIPVDAMEHVDLMDVLNGDVQERRVMIDIIFNALRYLNRVFMPS